ncbi:MAG: PDZ domain-containing protein, partial [Oscillospiraceae bacterium]|nr:PDZ domain-containing protein [Oscillospiraceae bacterium]
VNGRQMTLKLTNIPSSPNPGAPIFNRYGHVVALRTPMYLPASNGTGYAIPVSAVKPVVDELMERGFVTDRPSIGVSVEEIPDRVRIYYGLPSGVYVASVQPGSGAEKAGIRAGDILTALNDQSVTSAASLEQLRNNYAAGDVVMLTIYRSGEYLQLPVSLTQQEQSN